MPSRAARVRDGARVFVAGTLGLEELVTNDARAAREFYASLSPTRGLGAGVNRPHWGRRWGSRRPAN